MSENIVEIFGLLGFFTSIVMFLPLVHSVWVNRSDDHALKSQSVWMQILWILNAVFWAFYGLGVGAIFTALPSFINFPIALFNLYLVARSKIRYRKVLEENKPFSPECACGYPTREGHKLYVTAAPGFGTVVDCDNTKKNFVVPIPDKAVENFSLRDL